MSTAYALAQDPDYNNSEIYLLDKWAFESPDSKIPSANPTASSTDTSRIVRSDYTKGAYADLAVEAQERWRGEWGAEGRYSQSGYILIAKEGDTERLSTGGYNHVTLAYENAIRVAGDNANIEFLDSDAEIERVSGYLATDTAERKTSPNDSKGGSKGYINRGSGWADAAASLQYLRSKVLSTNRVRPIHGTAQKLLYHPSQHPSGRRTVRGVLLTSGQTILASQTILACGPHTPGLTDLRAACEARGQVSGYLRLTAQERAHFPEKGSPCMMDASTGIFVVGPDHEGYLKITRDSKGYRNPVHVNVAGDGNPHLPGLNPGNPNPTTENGSTVHDIHSTNEPADKLIPTSLPWPSTTIGIPPDGEADLYAFLARLFPSTHTTSSFNAIPTRRFEKVRTCWYCDTRTANFIISYHPNYEDGSLFIATGGSGHAFKFLPVIGEKVVAVLKCGTDDEVDGRGAGGVVGKGEDIDVLKKMWKFPLPTGEEDDGIVFCQDGSRHGRGDMVFEECLNANANASTTP